MSARRPLSTRKVLVATVGVAVVTVGTLATGCHDYPVGNLMPPREWRDPDGGDAGAATDPRPADDAAAPTRSAP